ncbi:MAG: tetratricopeptide repeat protein [Bacteroidia bacterium]|nr:tetratricopeptide repeat protein [Bacteroidia bacterium]
MHRLLAHFVQQAAPDDTAQAAVEQTMHETAERLNEAGDPRPLLVLQPHLRHITDTASPRGDEQAANLCNTLGYHLDMTGEYAGAKPYLERALAICTAALGADHPHTKVVRGNLEQLVQEMEDTRTE